MASSGRLQKKLTVQDYIEKACLKTSLREDHKKLVCHQALRNLGLDDKKYLTSEEIIKCDKELESIIYSNSGLPNFFADNDDHFQTPNKDATADEKYSIHARNLLKHLMRGTTLCDEESIIGFSSALPKWEIYKSLVLEKDACLLDAIRKEMQNILDKAFNDFLTKNPTADAEKQYEIFQSNLLAAYPFMDPKDKEQVSLPQKIDGAWLKVQYEFKKLDISPKAGPLSWVLEDKDRIFAYALEPKDNNVACSHLIFMGTTYPTGQGADLANIYNFYPRHSVGEAHNMKAVNSWLDEQDSKVKITGHSKGATMAMIMAAKRPDKILHADCLNPTGLCGDSLDRLTPAWKKATNKPRINVYTQEGDPVFPLEKGFLEGTDIYRIIPKNVNKLAMNILHVPKLDASPIRLFAKPYEAHIHHFAGRKRALILKVNPACENASKKREFNNDVKYMVNWVSFSYQYTNFFLSILGRKIERFYQNHKKLIIAGLIIAALVVCVFLAYTGVLAPLIPFVAIGAKLGLAKLGISVVISPAVSNAIMAGLAVAASFLVPATVRLASKLSGLAIKATLGITYIATFTMAFTAGILLSGIKQGFKAIARMFTREQEDVSRSWQANNMLEKIEDKISSATKIETTNTVVKAYLGTGPNNLIEVTNSETQQLAREADVLTEPTNDITEPTDITEVTLAVAETTTSVAKTTPLTPSKQ